MLSGLVLSVALMGRPAVWAPYIPSRMSPAAAAAMWRRAGAWVPPVPKKTTRRRLK